MCPKVVRTTHHLDFALLVLVLDERPRANTRGLRCITLLDSHKNQVIRLIYTQVYPHTHKKKSRCRNAEVVAAEEEGVVDADGAEEVSVAVEEEEDLTRRDEAVMVTVASTPEVLQEFQTMIY